MSQRHLFVLALVLPGMLAGCSVADQGKPAATTATPATTVSAAATPVATPAADSDVVDMATDESCRNLALQVIRQHDPNADRVFLRDSTPAGRYHRDGKVISGDHGQYRTGDGWTALASFRCTVDDADKAVSFDYQPGKAQTWAEMGDRH